MAGVDSGLYGALATVAAITTALQAAVALVPLNDSADIKRRKDSSASGLPEYERAKSDAGARLRTAVLLNIPAAAVNAAVLASWGGIGIFQARWVLWLPWVAVASAAVFLLACAVVGAWKLNAQRR
jgi:hypothetical protein